MYFKKLEIVGFKSFYNKTTLHFEPGITAVVGPNGCGKSNIFDSIRWVLGEQSVKELRGSDMQDVIFNGTDTKEPLGMAEVSLTFDNSQKQFSVENDEVVITRRLFRSGESEYLLNKVPVRLKDILDLLMGTGIGAESYSLIQQGKIDLILSSRPEDRRLVFDEASGITKYKSQKRETLRKLEETEQNLLRVNDIVTEVKRQIGSLERQANKARRYKEVFENLKSKEITLSFWQKKHLEEERQKLKQEVNRLNEEEAKLITVVQEEESRISNRQAQLQVFEERIMELKNQILNLNNCISRNNERLTFNHEKINELTASRQYLGEQIEQTKSRLAVDEEKLHNVQREYESIRKNIDDKGTLLKAKEEELAAIISSIHASLETVARTKKSVLDLAAKIASVKNEISQMSAQSQILAARQKRLELEKAKVIEEKTQAQEELEAITGELALLETDFEDCNLRLSRLKQELESAEAGLKSVDASIEGLEKQKISLQSHKEFLEKLKTKYADISESMNAVVYMDKAPAETMGGLVIKIKNYLALDERDKALHQFAGFKLSGEAKPIDLDTQNIGKKIAEIDKKTEVLKQDRLLQETRINDLNKNILDTREALRQKEMILVNKKANYQTKQEQFNKIKEEEEIILLELSDVDSNKAALTEKLTALTAELTQHEGALRCAEDLIHTEQAAVESNGMRKEETVVVVTQTKTEVDALNKRIGLESSTLKILQDSYDQDTQALSNLERQMSEAESRCRSLSVENADLETQARKAKEDIQKENIVLAEAQVQYDSVSMTSVDVVKKIESDRKTLDVIRNNLHEFQMRSKDTDFNYQSMKDRMLQAYKVDLDSYVLPESAEPINQEGLFEEIGGLKERLDSYGTVNLVAIEEYDELKKRYDFLTQQQNDLTAAKESLHEAILKINRTTKKMFLDTFELVRQEFRNYFKLLFNGGDAQIFLLDEQDPLESGIEIICRPPGKKLQNVLLLSGGEKALSAIGLIFAIFKVKPAPFCVLDEIDAALDEANVDRYSRMLQEFVKISQFIVITHNKRTIANADVMYGITMEESGISKIVSVKFAKNNDTQKTAEQDKERQVAPVG